jgi:2-oxo-3-hexenedioate decarboxylase/2-keto-4-pentenoate hydratase
LDLTALTGVTRINGVEVGRGRSRDVMGHPFEALAWLANNMAGRGRGLRAGEFVFTGSVVETKWLNRGDRVAMLIDGLGEVEAVFE